MRCASAANEASAAQTGEEKERRNKKNKGNRKEEGGRTSLQGATTHSGGKKSGAKHLTAARARFNGHVYAGNGFPIELISHQKGKALGKKPRWKKKTKGGCKDGSQGRQSTFSCN